MATIEENNVLNTQILSQAAKEARGLAIDAVTACKSGHLGLPLGMAEIGAVLFGHALQFNPQDPHWLNRDRFILSAGHGSMFLYAWLHLSGYDLPMEEIKRFRQKHSKTPGHPEFGDTPGVECTTGPLGQGVGNAIGMAMGAKMAQSRFNTINHIILDHHVICLCSDGDLQEGVAAEALSLAGRHGLDNLIFIYDSNDVTLDAPLTKSQSDHVPERFRAYGFDVDEVNGHDMEAFLHAFTKAKNEKNGNAKIIIAKTIIGKGIKEVQGTSKAHGEAGAKFSKEARQYLGLPEETFYVSKEVKDYFMARQQTQMVQYKAWQTKFKSWQKTNPELAKELQAALERKVPADLLNYIPEFDKNVHLATRASGGKVLNAIATVMPQVISGSADLHGSTKNYIENGGDFDNDCLEGRNLYFGIREHGMGAIVNGFGYYGIFRPSGATFLVFSDYMRAALRLAGVSRLPIFHIFTHDSIGVGEDGPTHQPIEQISALRLIPNWDIIRPADAEEVAGAFCAAMEKINGPTALILSRQDLPILNEIPVKDRREGVLKGGYIAKKEQGNLECILLASGSELQHAMKAAEILGEGIRVVSMPCFERFDRQSRQYQNEVLPSFCDKRVAIEAGVPDLWYKYVGTHGAVIGIRKFGMSAPGDQVMTEYAISAETVVREAKKLGPVPKSATIL